MSSTGYTFQQQGHGKQPLYYRSVAQRPVSRASCATESCANYDSSDTVMDEEALYTKMAYQNFVTNHRNNASVQEEESPHRVFSTIDEELSVDKDQKKQTKNKLWRISLGAIMMLLSVWIWWNYGQYLTFKSLRTHHQYINDYVAQYPYTTPLLYIVTVIIVVGLTLPGATVLSMAAGLIFRQPWASIYAWLGCGIGACICYGLVKSICADCLKNQVSKYSKWFRSFEEGLRANELLYLIYARYMIIIPFWFVNVAAALLEVRTEYFVISTLLATIPGSLLYTTAGRGLANAFELYRDDISTWTLWKQVLFTNEIKFCLLLLFICGLFPIGIRYYNNKNGNNLSYTNITSRGKKGV